MAVTVRVVGDLRRFAPAESVQIGEPVCTVGGAVDELVKRNPRLREQLFDGEGRLHHAVVLALDGRAASWGRDKESRIADGGELVLTRFHCGG